jgi:DNA-binding transcriptional LysR family regulator
MKLELDTRLRVFAAYARQRSFSKAADDLFISQPAVSKQIADLERDLDIQLVNRKLPKAGLTEAGEFLAQYVLQAEALLSQALRGLEAYKRPEYSHLTLAASGTPGHYLLPPLMATFQLAHPNVHVTITISTSNQVVEAVRQHKAELGILGGLITAPEVEADPLIRDDIVLIGPPSLANKRFTTRELGDFAWIHREEGSSTRSAVEAAWKDLGITPKARIDMPSWETVKQAVINNVGIAGCSRLILGAELKAGLIVLLDAPFWKLQRTISLIYMANVPLTPSAELFRAELHRYIKKNTGL